MKSRFLNPLLMASLFSCLMLSGCRSTPPNSGAAQNRVVLYCSVDDVYARPIIAELEKKTGLKIEALYDVEAAKTAGLANRIRAEKSRPRGDVFWSSALLQTLLLKREGLLQEYSSPSAKDIPAAFKDKKGAWTGMGVRDRVVMFRGGTYIGFAPRANALLDERWKNKIGISNPQFGTASDWAAALTVRWGKEKTLNYFHALKKNGVRVLPGNGIVAENIVKGDLVGGVTDSDDFFAATRNSQKSFFSTTFSTAPLATSNASNEILIPGSVAILKSAPNSANAQKLVDALVSKELEDLLIQKMKGVSSLRTMKNPPPEDTQKWADAWLSIRDPLFEILLTP